MSSFDNDLDSIDKRIKIRHKQSLEKERANFDPNIRAIDVGTFDQNLSSLALTVMYKVEREGQNIIRIPDFNSAIGLIMRQVIWTFNHLRWVNADDTRHGGTGYYKQYSFVTLPLIRTLIDGFYNCTVLMEDPSLIRKFHISGLYRLNESLREDEERYHDDPEWLADFENRRNMLEIGLRILSISAAEISDNKNRWQLLGEYLRNTKPDTPHSQLIRFFTHAYWKTYSSISHASFDGLMDLYTIIANDHLPHDMRNRELENYQNRTFSMHYVRAAVLVLSLLTEIQHFFSFVDEDAKINQRLRQVWDAMMPFYEVKEIYTFRYRNLLKIPEHKNS